MNPIRKTRCCAATLGAVVLAGCVGPGVDETVLPTRINYQCADNKVLQVERAPDARAAAVLVNNKPVVLQRAGSAALRVAGERTDAADDGSGVRRCVRWRSPPPSGAALLASPPH
jgi:hypothetical protein